MFVTHFKGCPFIFHKEEDMEKFLADESVSELGAPPYGGYIKTDDEIRTWLKMVKKARRRGPNKLIGNILSWFKEWNYPIDDL